MSGETAAPGTSTKVRIEVYRQTKRLKFTAIGLFVLLLLLSGAYLWQTAETARRLTEQRRLLLGEVDSLMQQIGTLAAGSEGLHAALDSAQSVAEQLKLQLAATPNDAASINDLRRRLDAAMRGSSGLWLASRRWMPAALPTRIVKQSPWSSCSFPTDRSIPDPPLRFAPILPAAC